MTYILLNLAFTTAALVFGFWVYPKPLRKVAWFSLIALALTTAIFDNLIVGFKIVAYDSTKISGIFIGCVPIEDFCYSLAAIWLVPAVWHVMARAKRTG